MPIKTNLRASLTDTDTDRHRHRHTYTDTHTDTDTDTHTYPPSPLRSPCLIVALGMWITAMPEAMQMVRRMLKVFPCITFMF